MKCKKCSLLTIYHNDVVDEWGALCASPQTPSTVAHKQLINYGGLRMAIGATAADHEEEETDMQKED